jgi:hypothetical protein
MEREDAPRAQMHRWAVKAGDKEERGVYLRSPPPMNGSYLRGCGRTIHQRATRYFFPRCGWPTPQGSRIYLPYHLSGFR